MSEPGCVSEATHLQYSSAPLVETSINRFSSVQLHTRKRRREREDEGSNALEPFQIKPYPPSLLYKPITGWPQHLLYRAQLPLSVLEPNNNVALFGNSRFFSGYVASLESPHDANSTKAPGPPVLIARLDTHSLLYAIEMVDQNVYSICRLSKWVDNKTLRALASPSQSISLPRFLKVDDETQSNGWWSSAIVGSGHDAKVGGGRYVEKHEQEAPAAIESPHLVEPAQLEHIMGPKSRNAEDVTRLIANMSPGDLVDFKSSAQTTLGQIVSQYLDALYMSKTSLAYFAKGPLSRARAAFLSSPEGTGTYHELSETLRSIVLAPSTLDKKYKESVPSVAKLAIEAAAVPQSTIQDPTPQAAKQRKSKKLRPGKDGLFPNEESLITRWWHSDNVESAPIQSARAAEVNLKERIAYIRFRETLLQLILHLEILALEEPSMVQDLSGMGSIIEKNGIHPTLDESSSKSQKLKKPRDLNASLETLIDRLTIWQSVDYVEQSTREPHNSDASATAPEKSEDTTTRGDSGDQLKNFYTEVVMPFYASRLPNLIEKLAHNLGKSNYRSPLRKKLSSSARKTSAIVPEAEDRRNSSTTGRRSLHRISTGNAKTSSRQVPSLMRSATDSLLQEVKRERSTTPQTSFSLQGSKRSLSRSSSINQAKSLSQREVDLGAIAKFNEAKSKKKVNAEQELQDAIAALKKPNRALAVKELVDAADARKLPSSRLTQKSASLHQRKNGLNVQVNGTPKRQKVLEHSIAATPRRAVVETLAAPDQFIPSSDPCIPASTIRPSSRSVFLSGSGISPPIWKPPPLVSETPSRNRGGRSYSFLESRMEGSMEGFEHCMATSKPKPKGRYDSIFTSPGVGKAEATGDNTSSLIMATPFGITLQTRSLDTATTGLFARQGKDTSIYDGLGWNNEDDDG